MCHAVKVSELDRILRELTKCVQFVAASYEAITLRLI